MADLVLQEIQFEDSRFVYHRDSTVVLVVKSKIFKRCSSGKNSRLEYLVKICFANGFLELKIMSLVKLFNGKARKRESQQ